MQSAIKHMGVGGVIATCREDLGAYMIAMMPSIRIARVHDFLIGELLAAVDGVHDRLMIFMPPGTGKSTLVGTAFPAWYLGRYPDRYFLDITYAQDVANDLGRGVRNLIADPLHRAIFPDSILARDSRAVHKFALTAGGRFKASGIGGPITGKRAHIVVIDDWVKDHIKANDQNEQRKAHEWFKSVVYDRLVSKAVVIISGTRWAHGDLAGRILEDADYYHVIKIPALAGLNDPMGRSPGEWHYPEAYPADEMERKRRNVGETNWNAKYQQEPVLHDGTLFKRDRFRYGQTQNRHYIIQSWDTAFEDAQESDWSACTTWAMVGTECVLLDASRWKVKSTDLYTILLDHAAKFGAHLQLIEDKGSGKTTLHRLQRESTLATEAYNPKGTKVARAIDILDMFETGRVYFERQNADYENELLSFPFGRHDDFVDSTTQALAYMRAKGGQRVEVRTAGVQLGATFRNY